MPDWPLQGPRVTLELLKSIRSGPGDLATYHLSWAQSSGVNKFSSVAILAQAAGSNAPDPIIAISFALEGSCLG